MQIVPKRGGANYIKTAFNLKKKKKPIWQNGKRFISLENVTMINIYAAVIHRGQAIEMREKQKVLDTVIGEVSTSGQGLGYRSTHRRHS